MKTLASSQQTLSNPANGVFIISNWSTHQTTVISDTPPQCSSPVLPQLEGTIHCKVFSPPLFSSSKDEVQEEADGAESEVTPPPLHTVAFKVMGTTKIAGAQEVLEEARDRLHQNENVPVQIILEPKNPVDKAFKCIRLIESGLCLDMLQQKSQINCILQCTTTLLWV